MTKKLLSLTFAATLIMFFVSCAKEKDESIEDVQDRLLKSYIHVVHLDTIQPTEQGYYVIPLVQGNGAIPNSGNWLKWDETLMSLDGTVGSTTVKDTAVRYGLFDRDLQTTHYVPNYMVYTDGYIYKGLMDAFKTMRVGSTYRFIFPARLLMAEGSSSSSNSSASYIMDVTFKKIISDPSEYEKNQIFNYRNANFPGLDTAKTNLFLYKTYTSPDTVRDPIADTIISIKDTTTISANKTVNVWYVGKFLDGFVFDTNIADSAKAHNIYSSSNTYSALAVTVDGGSVISGFNYAVKQLKEGDACTVFFTSTWGYGASGSSSTSSSSTSSYYDYYSSYYSNYYGSSSSSTSTTSNSTVIQSYTPLLFNIWIESIGTN